MSNTKMVEAYVCNHCGDIFKTKEEAYACFKECEEDLNVKKTFAKLQNKKNELRLKATSFNHFAKLLEEFARKNRREIEVEFCNLRYEKYISNAYDCPIGGQTNWKKEKDKPTSYPGYIGKVVFKKIRKKAVGMPVTLLKLNQGHFGLVMFRDLTLGVEEEESL
jgi:hypothetical protein